MKSKTKVGLLVALLFLHQTRSALAQNIVVSEVESFIVGRILNFFDSFTVNMKSNYTCTTKDEGVPKWCKKLDATHVGSSDLSSCQCRCSGTFYTFVPSLQKCINANEAFTFGGKQRAKKVVSYSPGLVDFAIGRVNTVINLPDGH